MLRRFRYDKIEQEVELVQQDGWEIKQVAAGGDGSKDYNRYLVVVFEMPVTDEDFEIYRARIMANP